jgi:hypothetical protein
MSNWLARFPRLPQLAALNRVARALPGRRRRVWFSGGENAYVYGRARALADRLFPMPVEGEPVYRASGVPSSDVAGVPAPVSGLARAFDDVRRLGGGSVLISKRIANNQRIGLLDETFPGARFVSMVRDGRAVACSLSRVDWWPDSVVPWYGKTPRDWEAEGRDPWELCARTWVEESLEVRRALGAVDHVHEVRYERLVEDPVPVLEEVGRFVGLEPDPRWTSALRGMSYPNRNETWRAVLDPAVVDRITEIQRPLLDELGYLEGGEGR